MKQPKSQPVALVVVSKQRRSTVIPSLANCQRQDFQTNRRTHRFFFSSEEFVQSLAKASSAFGVLVDG